MVVRPFNAVVERLDSRCPSPRIRCVGYCGLILSLVIQGARHFRALASMEGLLVICLESGVLLWHKAVVRNNGMPGKPRDPMNMAACFFALYKNAQLAVQPRGPSPLAASGGNNIDAASPPPNPIPMTYNVGKTTLYFRADAPKQLLIIVFTPSQLSREIGDALSDWICAHYARDVDKPRFSRRLHERLHLTLTSAAYAVLKALVGKQGLPLQWMLAVRGEDLKRAGKKLHAKRSERQQGHISPLADIRCRLFGLDRMRGGGPSSSSASSSSSSSSVDVMLLLQLVSKAGSLMEGLGRGGQCCELHTLVVRFGGSDQANEAGSIEAEQAEREEEDEDEEEGEDEDDEEDEEQGLVKEPGKGQYICVVRLEEFKLVFPVTAAMAARRDEAVTRLWQSSAHRPIIHDFLALARLSI